MTQSFKVELLYGLLAAGNRHTLAELRDATGHDEAMLADLGRHATPAERASATLAALTLRIGGIESPAMEQILELTAGDRERLLLALCARLLGPEIDLVATCPSCGEVAELSVRFADIMAAHSATTVSADPHVDLDAGGETWVTRLRPPTGANLEQAARSGPQAAHQLIISCVVELTDPCGKRVAPSALPAACESQLADALLALDPAAETRIGAECPSCGQPIDALLDGYVLLQNGFGGSQTVYDDVFRMARAYHWSEAEILSLPPRRRRHYLAIAAEAGP
ncbi:MAG: hypothetical protein JNJ53_11880 [Rhizobiales bacterium]|nr:hypothetical protein [Hyphomicrobiales bacterium]